jgi:hypothetical protein
MNPDKRWEYCDPLTCDEEHSTFIYRNTQGQLVGKSDFRTALS